AVPGAVAIGVLGWMHGYVGDPPRPVATGEAPLVTLPRTFYVYAVACALTTAGLMTFGVISFHLVHEHLVTVALVPVVYAAAMGAEALVALGTGVGYGQA